ncbi:MAG: TIGR02281 family clan AA aspartic protease [Ectothiorhodospiraceae bacterium]|nr:TIGR02281 family clan AA aspartic protease [Chromatiales bacterium]MCP5156330.1 TIGR02281 family clan AA aspartic protease [Ectothiorhodospiraceae bacterium]
MSLLALLVVSAATIAAPEIGFVGMHGARANLRIDGRPVLLGLGETHRGAGGAVTLLAVDRARVMVRVDGVTLRLDRGAARAVALSGQVELERQGAVFVTTAAINGQPIELVVDTGASHVVLSGALARRLRLHYTTHDPVRIRTASREELAYRVVLDTVQVGGIVQTGVPALITRGAMPEVALLGMSFLGRLDMIQRGDRLVLRER